VTVLFVENDDSFSFNVVDLLPSSAQVVRAAQALALLPSATALVIGPGPTDPLRAGLVELTRQALAHGIPLLGVCLGHQALGLACGASLQRSTPVHGKRSTMSVRGSKWLPDGSTSVMRYHSLSLAKVVPPLRVTGVLDDGTVMMVEHDTALAVGFQFHPDSYATDQGPEFVAAFFRRVP
jgi:anthranilate synthase/aminodeoxychorismate synthase-like glutamine amidotransferase